MEAHNQELKRMKWQFLNDYATRIDAKNTYAALAAGFSPNMLQAYRGYHGYRDDDESFDAKFESFETMHITRPVSTSVELAPFMYDVYLAGSDSSKLAKIAEKHAAELQELDINEYGGKRIATASMIGLVQAIAEKEGKDEKAVYEKLDTAFSSRTPGFWKTSLPKDHLEAFHLAGRYIGAEKLPNKNLQDIADIIYTKPNIATKEQKLNALRLCAKKYLSNPRTNEEYLVILADCRQDIRKLIDGKISQECFDAIKEISPDMAKQLKGEGFVGRWHNDSSISVPRSRFDSNWAKDAKHDLESVETFAKPFRTWKDKLMTLSPNSSEKEFKEFHEATEAFADTETDAIAAKTIRLCGKVITAFTQKDFSKVHDLATKMTDRIHTHEGHYVGGMEQLYVSKDRWSEDGNFYEVAFARDTDEWCSDYLAQKTAAEAEAKAREQEAKRQAELAAKAEAEKAAKLAEEKRRENALKEIGAFQDNVLEAKDFEPISLSKY